MTAIKSCNKFLEEFNILQEKVDQLEIDNQISVNQIEFLLEIIKILSEFDVGKALVNRAINKQSINKLKSVILPRRKRDLIHINNDNNIPDVIKQELMKKESDLISKAIRVISHREHFEKKSSENMRNFFKYHIRSNLCQNLTTLSKTKSQYALKKKNQSI